METQKKTWEKPQLIILARGTPEESVLTFCKTRTAMSGMYAVNDHNHCSQEASTSCAACQAEAASGS
jgi:hypothetical protein